ncbi:MAG: hypothetical protein ACLUKO_04085 [Enterocloster bolteae]
MNRYSGTLTGLLDLMLPDGNGYCLHCHKTEADIPVIFLTAMGMRRAW